MTGLLKRAAACDTKHRTRRGGSDASPACRCVEHVTILAFYGINTSHTTFICAPLSSHPPSRLLPTNTMRCVQWALVVVVVALLTVGGNAGSADGSLQDASKLPTLAASDLKDVLTVTCVVVDCVMWWIISRAGWMKN